VKRNNRVAIKDEKKIEKKDDMKLIYKTKVAKSTYKDKNNKNSSNSRHINSLYVNDTPEFKRFNNNSNEEPIYDTNNNKPIPERESKSPNQK